MCVRIVNASSLTGTDQELKQKVTSKNVRQKNVENFVVRKLAQTCRGLNRGSNSRNRPLTQ